MLPLPPGESMIIALWEKLQKRVCQMGKQIKPRLLIWALILLAVVFILSAAMLARHYIKAASERKQLEELATLAETTKDIPSSAPAAIPSPTSSAPAILEQYRALHEQNPDMAGWIKIDGTPIDYPVMYTSDDFYLAHGFDGTESKSGVPFIDARCSIDSFGTNTIIYGHHMKDGTMFAGLMEYEDEGFYEAHPTIRFDTLYAQQEYEIIAAFESRIYRKSDTVFKHYNFLNAGRQADFDEYIANIKALSLYDTGTTATFGDELITLVTCAYHTENGQFVVVARKQDTTSDYL